MPVVPEPYAPAAQELGITQEKLLEHLEGMKERVDPAPRRGDPLPPPRRLQRERHGRLEGARGPHRRARPADGRLPRHQPLLPAPDVRGLAVLGLHDGPRPLEGGVRRDPRRDRRRVRHRPSARRSTPRPSSRRSVSCTSRTTSRTGSASTPGSDPAPMVVSVRDTKSAALYERALRYLPGGVNSPVRAMQSIGRDPIFVRARPGRRDRRRRRQPLRRLGHVVGPAHPRPRAPGGARGGAGRRASTGRRSARRPPARSTSPRRSRARMPSVEMLRMTSSGTEASMSAIRLARAATGREKLLKFAGAYHGHVDGLLAEAGSRPGDAGRSRRAPASRRRRPQNTVIVAVERRRRRSARPRRRARVRRDPRRAVSRRTWASSRPPRASSSCCATWRPRTARCSSSTR